MSGGSGGSGSGGRSGGGTLSLNDAMEIQAKKEGYNLNTFYGKEQADQRVRQVMPTVVVEGSNVILHSPNQYSGIGDFAKSQGYKYSGSGNWQKSVSSASQAKSEFQKIGSKAVDVEGHVRSFLKASK
jgi:hypothetical protein